MSTVNEKGKKYTWVAIADDSFGYGMLSEKPISKINEIGRFIESTLKDTSIDAELRKKVVLMESCLFKLQAVLYHIRNIESFKENFLSSTKRDLKNKDVSIFTMGYLPRELVFEFEALLLQARACLDALTVLVTSGLHGQRTNHFSKLKKVLKNYETNDYAKCITELLNDCDWLYENGILTSDGLSTRSYVAHEGSLLTMQECTITISGIGEGKLLFFDLEFRKSVPVMNTASKILEFVPYLTINVLSILCGLAPVSKKDFANDLGKEFIILSGKNVDPENGVKVGIVKEMNRVNFIIEDRYISKDALSKALQIARA